MRVPCLALVIFLVAGCEEGGPTMRPGEDCIKCHGFSAAGTVFPSTQASTNEGINGVTITVVDSDRKTVTMTSNSAGNFYTEAAIKWPADITLILGGRTASMAAAPRGACASCHSTGGEGQGRVALP